MAVIRRIFRRIYEDYTFFIHPKWKFFLVLFVFLIFYNSFLYILYGHPDFILYQDRWFLGFLLFMNICLIISVYQYFVTNGVYKKRTEMVKKFKEIALSHQKQYAIKDIYKSMSKENRHHFIELLYDSDLRKEILDQSKL